MIASFSGVNSMDAFSADSMDSTPCSVSSGEMVEVEGGEERNTNFSIAKSSGIPL